MARAAGIYDTKYAQDISIVRGAFQWAVFIGALILIFSLPLFLSSYLLGTIIIACIMLIAALGLNILMGYGGQVSLGHAAFIAVGGYTTATLMKYGCSFWATIPLAAIAAAAVGTVFGLPSFRLKMFYLAMSTLAAQFIIIAVLGHAFPDVLGGMHGVSVARPELGGIDFYNSRNFYYIVMPMTVIAVIVAKNLVRGRLGRALVAVRDNDLASEVLGINVFRHKLYAFAIGCAFAGVAGSLWATWLRYVSPGAFPLDFSIWFLGALIVGGMGSTAGVCFGVFFLRGLQEMVTIGSPILGTMVSPIAAPKIGPGLGALVFGAVVVLFLLFEPRGLNHIWVVLRSRLRHWPFTYG